MTIEPFEWVPAPSYANAYRARIRFSDQFRYVLLEHAITRMADSDCRMLYELGDHMMLVYAYTADCARLPNADQIKSAFNNLLLLEGAVADL
jgi:hypothetical protein